MAQVLVRQLNEQVVERLKKRAKEHGRYRSEKTHFLTSKFRFNSESKFEIVPNSNLKFLLML